MTIHDASWHCPSSSKMSSWKSYFKLGGKVFAILRKALNVDGGKTGHLNANSLANGHEDLDFQVPRTSGSLTPTPRHANPQSDVSSKTSSPGDTVHDADIDIHPRYESPHSEWYTMTIDAHRTIFSSGSFFSGARNFTLNGGEFYNVGGDLTIQQRTGNEDERTQIPKKLVEWQLNALKPAEAQEIKPQMDIHAQMNDRRLEEMMGRLQLPRTVSVGLVYIMDATGRQHALTMNMARSFEQLSKALRVLFEPATPQDRVLHKYMDCGAYDLTVDDGKANNLPLTEDLEEEWSSVIQSGTTIVMSVVMVQQTYRRKYRCPFCEIWNPPVEESSIDCHSCKRRFQVTVSNLNATGTNITLAALEMDSNVPRHERDLIRNIHLKRDDNENSNIDKFISKDESHVMNTVLVGSREN
ncbi:hypothetical protein M413DRAFT_14710 [Hebeloma cylindrosporum]|uniref:Ubiquitin-like domain-containing protein n=1 Tax=Hebeloma cylindrosporum TaxID=76867 RepID=A0A0C3BUZ1_HEBCY|nr:hypothetical protein M413DRAFT_14710 [Hebeloma cylindrosporum h7]